MKLFILAAIMLGIVMLSQAKPYGGVGGYYGESGGFVHHDEINYGGGVAAGGPSYGDFDHLNCGPYGCSPGTRGHVFGITTNRRLNGHVPISSVSIIGGPYGGFPDNKGNDIGSTSSHHIGHSAQPSGLGGPGVHGIKGHGQPAKPGTPIYSARPFNGIINQNQGFDDHTNPNYGIPSQRGPSHRHPPGFYDRDHGISDHGPTPNLGPDGGLGNPSRGLSPGIFDGSQGNRVHGGSHNIPESAYNNRRYGGTFYGVSPGIYDEEHESPRGHIGGSDFYRYGGVYPSKGLIKGHIY